MSNPAEGQAAGPVERTEPGLWVELRSPHWSKIIVRLDRNDGVAAQ